MAHDDIDERVAYLAHDWTHDGEREVGGERHRCVRCGALRHWPLSAESCATVLEHRPEIDHDTPPLFPDQWPGPFARHPTVTCVICERAFRRPIGYGNASTCSSSCKHTKDRRRRAQRQRVQRALKRAQR